MNATVKRKFNALLQGIGNRPATDDRSLADPAPSSPASQRSSPYSSSRAMASDFDLHKKRRVGDPAATPTRHTTLHVQGTPMRSSPASIRSVPPSTTISNITLHRWTPGAASPAPDAREGQPPPPKYCPADRDQLLRRLATFQELTDWTPKPDRVSEVEWAKRGWVCHGKERVRCALCAAELVVKVNRKEVDGREFAVLIASEIAESVVNKYVELIVDAHAEDCLWRRKGCDDSLLRLPLPNPKLALQGLRQRYDELCDRAAFLPYESTLRLPPTLDLDKVITYLPPTFFTDPPPRNTINPNLNPTPSSTTETPTPTTTTPPPPTINRPALALALFGWQSLTHPTLHTPIPNSASCHTCLRRLGLWMFRPRSEPDPDLSSSLSPSAADNPNAAAAASPLMDYLNPLREHRFFCPWKNPAAQRNPGKKVLSSLGAAVGGDGGGKGEREMAAWEVLVTGLRNEAFIREKIAGSSGGSTTAAGGGKKMMHGRSKSSVPAFGYGASYGDGHLGPPRTPERPMTVAGRPGIVVDDDGNGDRDGDGDGDGEEQEDVGDEEARRKKDMAMMSRLRRVKSLFNTKAGGKLRRLGGSRPGTSHSNAGGE